MAQLTKPDGKLSNTGSFTDEKAEAYKQAGSILQDTELLSTDPTAILISHIKESIDDLTDATNTADGKNFITDAQALAIATNTTSAGKVKITANGSNDTTLYPLLQSATTLNVPLVPTIDYQGLSYNGSTNKLTSAGGFIGNVTGRADSANIALSYSGIKNSLDTYILLPADFKVNTRVSTFGTSGEFLLLGKYEVAFAQVTMPLGTVLPENRVTVTATGTGTVVLTMNAFNGQQAPATIASGATNADLPYSKLAKNFNPELHFLSLKVTAPISGLRLHSASIRFSQ